MQKQSKLICLKAMTRGAIRFQVPLVIFDVQLCYTARTVHVTIQSLRASAFKIRDNEAEIFTLGGVFDFANHAIETMPTVSGVMKTVKQTNRSTIARIKFFRACARGRHRLL